MISVADIVLLAITTQKLLYDSHKDSNANIKFDWRNSSFCEYIIFLS